ncbi:LbtU family siderophore porin [Thiotrichales bacterium 19S3-7]|nr:LbtU family siderophore porin [Thiotrichales bacterium 19S3-7]MCF6801071.1 LbtU family siderophore porin [Thiotrichales bacterium 19S3-11]
MIKQLMLMGILTTLTSGYAYAADQTNNSKESQIQLAKLQQLQTEVDELQAQLNPPTQSKAAPFTLANKTLRSTIYLDNNVEHTYLEGLSSSTRALSLLQVRNKFGNNAMVLGGEIETDTQIWWGDKMTVVNQDDGLTTIENGSGTYLTGANLDLLYNLGQWLQIYFETITYQDSNGIETDAESAFVTLGNLDKSPFFATMGKGRPMFGTLPGAPWAASIEQGLFRPGYINNITLGYNEGNFITNFTYISPSANHSTFLVDSFYSYDIPDTKWTLGGNIGYVNDINGTGMGIAATDNADTSRTPAVNVEGNIAWKEFTVYSGWESTLRNNTALDENGLSGVWYIQGVYAPEILGKETTFSASYAQSYNMSGVYFPMASSAGEPLSIIGPHQQFYVFVSRNVLDSVILSLEYAWIKTYDNQENNTITFDTIMYF